MTDELGQTQGRRRRKKKNRICATQTNLLLMETFSAKVGLFVSRKKQGEQEEKEKDFFIVFSLVFVICCPIIFKKELLGDALE